MNQALTILQDFELSHLEQMILGDPFGTCSRRNTGTDELTTWKRGCTTKPTGARYTERLQQTEKEVRILEH